MSTVDPDDDRQTAIIAVVAVAPPTREPASDRTSDTSPVTDSDPPSEVAKKPGLVSPRLVLLRPERVDDSYRSVHSVLTRTSSRTVVRCVGRGVTELLITFGLIAILFAGYEIWGNTRVVDAHQQDLNHQLTEEWATGPDDPLVSPTGPSPTGLPGSVTPPPKPVGPPPGNALARMYIPRLNKYWVVVEGVEPEDLKFSPGHYPKTAKAGQVGNFSVAGHRIPAMFWDLDTMRSGDVIVLETQSTWYIYKVTQVHVTGPNAVEVVAPVPGRPGEQPVDAMLTITTCEPKWDNKQRLVVHAAMKRQQPRSAGRPKELGT